MILVLKNTGANGSMQGESDSSITLEEALQNDPFIPIDNEREGTKREQYELADAGCLDDIRAEDIEPCAPENAAGGNTGPDLEELFENTTLEELRTANKFILELQNASFDGIHSGFDQQSLVRLRNPPTVPFTLENQPDLYLAFELFLASFKASVDVYSTTRQSILRRHPEDGIPSYDQPPS